MRESHDEGPASRIDTESCVGNDLRGQTEAIHFSLTSIYRRQRVDPRRY